jgi:signal transduction histidine kinase
MNETELTMLTEKVRRVLTEMPYNTAHSDIMSFEDSSVCQLLRTSIIENDEDAEFVNLSTLLSNLKDELCAKHDFIEIQPELPTIFINKTRIREVFFNLLLNSLAAIRNDGDKIEVGCSSDEKQFVFYVKDNGCGMSDEKSKQLFQIALQASSNNIKPRIKLGLFVVQSIVSFYQGSVWFKTTVGKGSCFYFSLPRFEIEQK